MPSSVAEREVRLTRRVRRWVVAAAAAYAFAIPSPEVGGPLAVTIMGVTYACRWGDPPRRISRRQRQVTAVLVALWLLAIPVVTGKVPWWQPLAVAALIGLLPFLVGLLYGLYHLMIDDDEMIKSDSRWLLYLVARPWLRMTIMIVTWLTVGTTLGGFRATLAVAAPVFACAIGRPVLGVLCLFATYLATGSSSPWCVAAALLALLAFARFPARPPKRGVGLPPVTGLAHPIVRLRLRAVDRALRLSEWPLAARRLNAMAHTGLPLVEAKSLRLALVRLEMGEPQPAMDVLGPALVSDDVGRRAAGNRLRGEALTMTDQPGAALDALRLASDLLPDDLDHQARTALAAAEAFGDLGDDDSAVERARFAAGHLRRRTEMVERMRAMRIAATSLWEAGKIDEATQAAKNSFGPGVSVRWIRQYMSAGGGHHRDDSQAAFSRGAPLLLEVIRMNFFDAQLALDPRTTSSDGDTADKVDSVMDDLQECAEIFRLLGSPLDSAEADLLIARLRAAKGNDQAALTRTVVALGDLDRVRHSLRTQGARARWSDRFNVALDQALDLADKCGDAARVAELIELARVQAVPLLGAALGDEDLALRPPPTVRVRGRAGIVRAQLEDGTEPVDLERAAASAAGEGAWWLASWATDFALFWVLIPPHGEIGHGRVDLGPGSDLAAAIGCLNDALPIRQEGEDDAGVDWRVARGPLLASHSAERRLATTLGRHLLPLVLREELGRRHRGGLPPLPLAISPAPVLGHIPWSLLAVEDVGADDALRLVETADWVLAPSATLLDAGRSRDKLDPPFPLRLAVLDPTDARPEFPALPAARSVATHLPNSVAVLGGHHWDAAPATPEAVVAALRRAGPSASVMFGCHAVRGDRGRPSDSAVVLAGLVEGEPVARLTAGQLFRLGIDPEDFPAQISLQACDTSDLASSAGGEWLSLAPGFLAAGARTVLTTLFPLVDTGGDPDSDVLLQAIIQGDDLAGAVRTAQLRGLSEWRRHWRRGTAAPLSDAPLVWSALAICATGRAPASDLGADEPTRLSPRLLESLGEAAGMALGMRDRTVTSAHFCASYAIDETDVFDGRSLVFGLWGTATTMALAKLLHSSAAEWPGEARPSRELLRILSLASARAALAGGALEPEHVIGIVLDESDALGRTLLRLSRLHRTQAFVGRVSTNLREAEVKVSSGKWSDSDSRVEAFVAGVATELAKPRTAEI